MNGKRMGSKAAAAARRASTRSDDGNAFFPDPEGGPVNIPDDYAEQLGEDFVLSATTGENLADPEHGETEDQEEGGPFLVTGASEEFAEGTDESNREDAEPAPFPTTMSNS